MNKSYKVEIEFDPSAPRGMRWDATIRDAVGYPLACRTCCFSRRSAERKALRFIATHADRRTFSFVVKADA